MLAGSADDNERRYLYNIIKNVINHLGEMEIDDESIDSLWQDLDGGF
jgi:predicted DNA binding CopG/RHH family protein